MGGVVRYAGYFKNYGQIIIVEHQKDYHSLIAGLARIDTVVGQSVAAGEPVGVLAKSSSDGGKPTLYYELRLNGEPVNPARKFAGL
jgi:murein hydrolase activator